MPTKVRQSLNSAKSKHTPPRKPKNTAQRKREYLTDAEIERLRKAASQNGRHGPRDNTLILIM